MYEGDFQSLIVTRAPELFEKFYVAPFGLVVESEHGTAKADLALIDRGYRAWWVIEVELVTHSLQGHVLPQVRRLATAEYGQNAVACLTVGNTDLNPARLSDMVKGAQPTVLVVANGPCPEWIVPLAAFDAHVAIVEVYRSDRDNVILRLDGYFPEYAAHLVSECFVDLTLRRLLVVDSPASLPVANGETLEIAFAGGLTAWRRVDIANRVYLNPLGPNPLFARRRYRLMKSEEGDLRFEDPSSED
jgi:hypothetical protein